eukprot:g4793.t1
MSVYLKPKSIHQATQDHAVDMQETSMAFKPNRQNASKGILATLSGKALSIVTSPVRVTGGNIGSGINGKYYIQYSMLTEGDPFFDNLNPELQGHCNNVEPTLKALSTKLLGLRYEHGASNPNILGKQNFLKEAKLSYRTVWNLTASRRTTGYDGAAAPPQQCWVWGQNGQYTPITLSQESLEGAICQIVIAKFILYRRDNSEYGIMHELGRDILVLKKGGVQEKPLLRFPSMGEVESDTLAAGVHSNSNRTLSDGAPATTAQNIPSEIDEQNDESDSEFDGSNRGSDDEVEEEEDYAPPQKKQKKKAVSARRLRSSAKAKKDSP